MTGGDFGVGYNLGEQIYKIGDWGMKSVKRYYSMRHGQSSITLTLDALREIFLSVYEELNSTGYFQQWFGIDCTDGYRSGGAGANVVAYVLRKLRRPNLWPIRDCYKNYSEGDLFDMIEFLCDHVSAPLEEGANYHSWDDCGWHYTKFDELAGKMVFATEINQLLGDYKTGYELDGLTGEILALAEEPEMQALLGAQIPQNTDDEIKNRMEKATQKFRRYGSTLDDRADAVRELADCLEYLRDDIKRVLASKDESDLFNIANNFAIRHSNAKQKANYDRNIWLSWIFYFYLSTLHTCLRLISKSRQVSGTK